ncbi:hypothetical protein GCM10027456_57570 [Kineosporia babensis]
MTSARLAVIVLSLAACSSEPAAGQTADVEAADVRTPDATTVVHGDPPPEGWRWESYQDVQIAVPQDWDYGIVGRPWCQRADDEKPFVGRPGPVREIACSGAEDAVEPGQKVSTGGQFVWFGLPPDSALDLVQTPNETNVISDGHGGSDRAVVQAGTVSIVVQAPAELRAQIISTVRLAEIDHNGCAAVPPYAGHPKWGPSGPEVTEYTDIKGISACSYVDAELVGSLRLNPEQATEAIAAIASAPVGGGPFNPAALCVPVEDESDDVAQLILQVDAAAAGTIVLSYGGCSSTGLDDGTAVRTLTRDSVQPFIQGPNRVYHWGSSLLDPIFAPDE